VNTDNKTALTSHHRNVFSTIIAFTHSYLMLSNIYLMQRNKQVL